jgi:hypothetical protein
MKESLGVFVDADMRCPPRNTDIEQIGRDLAQAVKAYKLPDGVMRREDVPADFGKYGFQLWFDVRATQQPRLLSVTAAFDIECGSDAVLFVFGPDGGSWKEVLRWQSKPYKTVAGAFWSFGYGISPPDAEGRWYVVTKHINPWCSSTWADIYYDVLRQVESSTPKVLLSGSDFMWWGNEDFGKLVVNRNEFDLRFHSESIDTGVHNRVWIRHYSVLGDKVKRIQPVAISPRDFVDEWIVSPWKDASHWSSKSALADLRQAHQMMSRRENSDNTLLEYSSVYGCSDARDHYQVEVSQETGPKFETTRSVFFHVAGRGNYTMKRVSETADPKCRGRNLLNSMRTKD